MTAGRREEQKNTLAAQWVLRTATCNDGKENGGKVKNLFGEKNKHLYHG